MMHDEAVCLGCGLVVGASGDAGCPCVAQRSPRPSAAPPSMAPSSAGPYRAVPPSASCPRCEGRLLESTVDNALVLDCTSCGGVFVTKALIDRLDQPGGAALRVAFPRHPRAPEPTVVRYLACPLCTGRMNRVNFARAAAVIVDVCKEDGIWFDAGEVHAVIDFVEAGGLERARARERELREEENARLRAGFRKIVDEPVRTRSILRPNQLQISAGDRVIVSAFFDWLKG